MIRRALVGAGLALLGLAGTAWADGSDPGDRLAQVLFDKGLVTASDRLWLAPTRAGSDPFTDRLTAALLQHQVGVVRDPFSFYQQSGADNTRQRLEMLKALGVTQVLSFDHSQYGTLVQVRLIAVPTGLVREVVSIQLAVPVSGTPRAPESTSVSLSMPQQALGLGFSFLSGSGVTYQRWFDRTWGLQVAAVPWVSLNSNNVPNGFVNAGVQGMRTIVATSWVRLYWLLGGGAAYDLGSSKQLNLGLAPGVGLDLRLGDNLQLTTALGYTLSRTSFADGSGNIGFSPGGTIGAFVAW